MPRPAANARHVAGAGLGDDPAVRRLRERALGGLAVRQVALLLISFYGWWAWSRRADPVYGVAIRRSGIAERLALLAALLVGTTVRVPADGAGRLVGAVAGRVDLHRHARGLLGPGRGLVEFRLVWLAVDAVGVPLQISSGLWFSAAIYVVFAALVIRGWWSCHREAQVQRANTPVPAG